MVKAVSELEYARTSRLRNSVTSSCFWLAVARGQCLPTASWVMRLKSKLGRILASTSWYTLFRLPLWISLSCFRMASTSCVVLRASTSGGVSAASTGVLNPATSARSRKNVRNITMSYSNLMYLRDIGYEVDANALLEFTQQTRQKRHIHVVVVHRTQIFRLHQDLALDRVGHFVGTFQPG